MPLARINRHKSFFDRIYEIFPTYSAAFGKGAAKPLREILEIRRDISIAAETLMGRDGYNTDEENMKFYRSQEEIVWDLRRANKDGSKSVNDRLNDLTKVIENQATPLLRTRYRTDR